jgi:hypothetical protein
MLRILAPAALIAAIGAIGLAASPKSCVLRAKPARADKGSFVKSELRAPLAIYFGRVEGTDIRLALPARPPELVGIGFHQAQNPRARPVAPIGRWLSKDSTRAARREVRTAHGRVVMFQMTSRGRGTSLRTAMDVVVRDGTLIVSPVSGEVTLIKHYRLYGRYDDLQIEIRPDGHPELRVVGIHMQGLMIQEGDRVEAGETALGKPRRFEFDSQVDRYVGGHHEHSHFQVNPYPPVKY